MVRRILISAGSVTLLTVILFGRSAASYVGTTLGWAQDSVRESIPVSFEIDRARKMVRDLAPDIRQNMYLIAKEEAEVAALEKQIAVAETRLGKDRTELMRLKSDVASGQETFTYCGRTYSATQVKGDLANRFTRYKTADATLASLREMHQARQRSLQAARQKVEGMLAAKRHLQVDVENLEARLKAVEVAQTTSDCNIDGSHLAHTKELIGRLRTRLDVAEKLANSETYFRDEIPVDDAGPENIVNAVTEYFGPETTQLAAHDAQGTL